MKKYLFLSMAFVATLAFVGCNNNEPEEGGTTGQKVKTQFALNIGSGSQTRMSAETVQANGTFRGMQNITLASSGKAVTSVADLEDATVTSWITLADLSSTEISTTNSSKVYKDVTVPVGTKTLFFYGKAKVLAKGQGFANGWTVYPPSLALGEKMSTYHFDNKIIITGTALADTDEAKALVAALNAIKGVIASDDELTSSFFTGNAGSSIAILKRVNALLEVLNADGGHALQATVEALFSGAENDVNKVFSLDGHVASLKTAYANFPAMYNLPEGAALLSTTGENFAYNTAGNVGNTSTQFIAVNNIVYPSELLYYVASPVRAYTGEVSNLTATNTWQITPDAWVANPPIVGTSAADWADVVAANSKILALAHNVNYGVAQLKTTVKAANDEDLVARKRDNTEMNVKQNVVEMTGMLVGGQPKTVAYNFLPKLEAGAEVEGMKSAVYDTVTPKAITSASDNLVNYTLVFDNYSTLSDISQKVTVALEFLYAADADAEPIQALDGVVYPGQKFYLLGQLKAGEGGNSTGAITWANVLNMFGGDDAAAKYFPQFRRDRVFVQDFTTQANFTVNSLKNAYVGIPDLRSSLLEFGLSVDLTWKSGLTFDVTID